MDNLWYGLSERLRAVANNKEHGGCQGVAIIEISLYFGSGQLVGWSRPERTSLEPRGFDTTIFDLHTLRDWNEVILALKRERGVIVKKHLVVRNGEPVGWFKVSEPVRIGDGARVGV